MEGAPQPQHRDNIQDLLDKAHDEAVLDNQELTGKKIIDEQYNHISDTDINGTVLESETWLNELQESLKKLGSKAEIDKSIEGGQIHLEIDQTTMENLKDYDSANKAFEEADNGSKSDIGGELKGILLTQPQNPNINFIVINHGKTTEQERNKLVEDMDKLGCRVPEFSELVALGIIKPYLNKIPDRCFVSLRKYSLVDGLRTTYFYMRGDGSRSLDADVDDVLSDEAVDGSRFLFVRK